MAGLAQSIAFRGRNLILKTLDERCIGGTLDAAVTCLS